MISNIVAFIFFGAFAIAGVGAFLMTSYSPIEFWIKNGYWDESPTTIYFGLLFLTTHGGIGFAGLSYLLLKKKSSSTSHISSPDKPWMSQTYWSKPEIPSKSINTPTILKYVFYYSLIISCISIFVSYHSFKRQEYLALLALVVPVLSFMFHYFWKKSIWERQHFGPMNLLMNPYPASIGGHLGGEIALIMNVRSLRSEILSSNIQLHCIRYYRSGDDSIVEIL